MKTKEKTDASKKAVVNEADRFVVSVGHSVEEQLSSKAYYEARTLKLIEQFSPQKPWLIPNRNALSSHTDNNTAANNNNNNNNGSNDPTQLSRLFAGVFAFVATGLYVSFDTKRVCRCTRFDCKSFLSFFPSRPPPFFPFPFLSFF
jgi:hypothetical protein